MVGSAMSVILRSLQSSTGRTSTGSSVPLALLACLLLVLLCRSRVVVAQTHPADGQTSAEAPKENVQGGTVLVTKDMTGPYRPRNRPKLNEAMTGVVNRTNAFRKEQGLAPLVQNEVLQKTAQEFADYMAKTGKYGHEADERTPSERVRANEYEYCFFGENIGMQFHSNGFSTGSLIKVFFQGWKNSPPHRENMLHADVTETGVGIAQSSETGAYFAVQLVGRPLSLGCQPSPSPEKASETSKAH